MVYDWSTIFLLISRLLGSKTRKNASGNGMEGSLIEGGVGEAKM